MIGVNPIVSAFTIKSIKNIGKYHVFTQFSEQMSLRFNLPVILLQEY